MKLYHFLFARPALHLHLICRGGGGLTSLTFSKNKWQPTKQMWHYNWALKSLTFTKAHLYGCPYSVEREPGPRMGWSWANTVGWAVNGLWEDRPVDEWTPELMGSVCTKLLRKENPSQGSHFTFYFYSMCHWLFSSAGFSGGSGRVPTWSTEKGHFFGPMYWIWQRGTGLYWWYSYGFMNPQPVQGQTIRIETEIGFADIH